MQDTKNITIIATIEELNIIMQGLMELQGKLMMPLFRKIEAQVLPQLEAPDATNK